LYALKLTLMTMCEVKANVDVVVKALIRDADPVGEC
jgi:hypothetical protein